MTTSSDTSTPDTPKPGRTSDTVFGPRALFGPLPSTEETIGSYSIVDCTMLEESPTLTSDDECDLDFLFQHGDRHPVGLVCRTHDMTFDIGTGI